MNLEDKIKTVKEIFQDKRIAIGFSGGADSTLLVYLASKYAEDTLAITIDNHLFPTGFIENAKKTTESFGVKHEIIDIDFYQKEDFLLNDMKRCFNCRKLMYDKIEKTANEKGFDLICDGNNISDLVNDRPGILITYAKGFKTPLIDAKLTSSEIHEYLNLKNIPFSRSTTCLATRIPTDTQITRDRIEKISHCEDFILANTNCEIVKVRDFDSVAVIEADNIDEISKEDKFKQISDELKRIGFEKVELNLSPIDDNESIEIDYREESFSFHLPFTIDLENTQKQLKNTEYEKSGEKIELEKITLHETGLIKGNDFEDYESASDAFMEILPKLRRNI